MISRDMQIPTRSVVGCIPTRSVGTIKSVADFIAKMGIVEEEADECIYWMELLVDARIVLMDRLEPLIAEADELVAITVASIRTAKENKK